MFGVKLDTLIGSIVRNALDSMTMEERHPHYDRASGVVIKNGIELEIALSVYDPMAEVYKEVERRYSILFCGNVNVFIAHTGSAYVRCEDIPLDRWVNTSNHDSCWATDGLQFLTQAYFEMCKEVDPDKAPVLLESTAQIGFLGKFHMPVRITYKRKDDVKNEIVRVELRRK